MRLLVTLALSAGLLTPASALTSTPASTPAAAPEGDVWVILEAGADLSAAHRTKNRTERGNQVVRALRDKASATQAPVLKHLAAKGLKSTPFWITNAILVKNAIQADSRDLAKLDGVAEVRPVRTYAPPTPVENKPSTIAPNGVEWGIANIKASEVWQQYGKRGEDIVVANIDTGVQYNHPALAASYRGNNGDGTFTHDYNWLDTSGRCGGAPCDTQGHGTHTMGTMAGDDGQGNQIGVAPGVKWIAANGCATCTDVDLVKSAQWMLAPTDAVGANPDVSKRPHIVNNSWGTTVPTDEPMMEDILAAWAASGIFGVWANGNSGPACKTSGSPGSRSINYSVGAYGSDNKIAPFSSRGPGQDGEVKPNISAPGALVRSTLPGSAYGLMSGTSMATPHVAGAIALLWSAEPSLARDIDATRALLDYTATDTSDPQCGGATADNNVYGEGRLDALALVKAGKDGLGVLSGKVTDAATGEPVAGATVSMSGRISREISTGADGTYTINLVGGDYQVAVTAFGYENAAANVTITKDTTIGKDVALTPSARTTVSGTVTDGSGHGWALGAEVTAADGAGHRWTARTDSETGRYELGLLPGLTYDLEIASPGYNSFTEQVAIGMAPLTVDAVLTVTFACTAPGYRATLDGPTESFSSGKPAGWTVNDTDPGYPGYDYKPGWMFDDPGERGNRTGGSGRFAVVDSDHYGRHHVQDSALVSPVLDMTGKKNPAVQFGGDYAAAVNATATVEVSVDGGRTWTTVWRKAAFPSARGPEAVPLPQAAGQSSVRVRFHYLGQRSGWWALDDVFLGNRTCDPVS